MKFLLTSSVLLLAASLAVGVPLNQPKAPRIVGGTPALPGQFPWQAFMIVVNDETQWTCHGAIISDQAILTTASCIYGARYANIYLGNVNYLQGTLVQANEFHYPLEYIHSEYDTVHSNNIGVIILPQKIEFSEQINKIQISTNSLNGGIPLTVSGWGRIFDSPSFSEVLLYTNMTSMGNSQCQSEYFPFFPLLESEGCAIGESGHTACGGEEGTALVRYASNGQPILVGIDIGNPDTCEENARPVLFSLSSYYKNWISSITGV